MYAPSAFQVPLRDSRYREVLLAAVHGLGALGLMCTPSATLYWPVQLVILLGVLGSWWWCRQQGRWQGQGQLRCRGDGVLEWLPAQGEARCYRVHPDSPMFSRVVVLRLELEGTGGGRRYHALFCDSMALDDWRRLRVWLRYVACL